MESNADRRVWLAKCCKIQQLAYLYSTTYIYAQQNIFLFNSLQLCSTFYIYVQQYAFSFHIQLNYFHSTTMFIQLRKLYLFYSTKLIVQL